MAAAAAFGARRLQSPTPGLRRHSVDVCRAKVPECILYNVVEESILVPDFHYNCHSERQSRSSETVQTTTTTGTLSCRVGNLLDNEMPC